MYAKGVRKIDRFDRLLQRVETLEKEVSELKRQLEDQPSELVDIEPIDAEKLNGPADINCRRISQKSRKHDSE
jgi:hypothetical protein